MRTVLIFDRARATGILAGLVRDAEAAGFEVLTLETAGLDYVTVLGIHDVRGRFSAGFHLDGKVFGPAFLAASDPGWRIEADLRSSSRFDIDEAGRIKKTKAGADKANPNRKPDGIGYERLVSDNGSLPVTKLRAWLKG